MVLYYVLLLKSDHAMGDLLLMWMTDFRGNDSSESSSRTRGSPDTEVWTPICFCGNFSFMTYGVDSLIPDTVVIVVVSIILTCFMGFYR